MKQKIFDLEHVRYLRVEMKKTYREIAQELGISFQRVAQLCKTKLGIKLDGRANRWKKIKGLPY